MKSIVFMLLLAFFACSDQRLSLPSKSTQSIVQELFVSMKHGLSKLGRFFLGKKNLPAYCAVVLNDSPTKADFHRNWQMDSLQAFCADNDFYCQQKNANALAKGLDCYLD